jgi:hypothetical protein
LREPGAERFTPGHPGGGRRVPRHLNGNLDYPSLLVLGNLFLLGTHTCCFRGPARGATLLGLGLLAGLGCRTNLLFVVYLAPLAWLDRPDPAPACPALPRRRGRR